MGSERNSRMLITEMTNAIQTLDSPTEDQLEYLYERASAWIEHGAISSAAKEELTGLLQIVEQRLEFLREE